ncbi:transcription initiation factor TFIID, subunit TAF5 [Trichodelitschia bisporula]|uniref:Transcription initiation factor TFIID, subunit TAF5 n=1 Tax=Trichodelitschia bisporula TaxID=703511 RepID=A0A6G1HW13_9PEZI|nr:transcription initiation factor TFIID, subunit TAF5 [Trichodelitschia bisporula]
MSNPPGAPSRSGSIANGPPSAGVAPGAGNQLPSTPSTPSQQNLNQIVLEYLSKKGYSKTESMLRRESAFHDAEGRPLVRRAEDAGGKMYERGYQLLLDHVSDVLEVYKPELSRLLWPVFVHSVLSLARSHYPKDSETFFNKYNDRFTREHQSELGQLQTVTAPEHVEESSIAKVYMSNKYRVTLTPMAYNVLVQFLEQKEEDGGSVIIALLEQHLHIIKAERGGPGAERSLAAMLARGGEEYDMPAEDEGIPGHNPGSANVDPNAPNKLPKLLLAAPPLDPDAMEDIRAELIEADTRNPPRPGQSSLLEEFEQSIKQEPQDEAASRDAVPLPPMMARDIAMEVQNIREHRDRFRIDPKSSGVGPGVSVCLYTFHNTHNSISVMEFSPDLKFVAVGFQQSYIRVWTVDGSPLPILTPGQVSAVTTPVNSKKLIGHSGPVYGLSFSPGTPKPSEDSPNTNSRYLLSSSADGTIRLWGCDMWTCLVSYRGHDAPVWDVRWGPHGHYFLSCGHDKVARIWTTDVIAPLRLFVGHESDVDVGCFHPSGIYVFTGGDRTVRMWEIQRGNAVRMFTGHTGHITAIECSPNGQFLASADDQGNIIIWDLQPGNRMKRMRGHGKGGIWSLSWSAESNVLVSSGADSVIRVWDVLLTPSEKSGDGLTKVENVVSAAGATGAPQTGSQKKGKKDVVVTPDQISAFKTKKTPVIKAMFTRSNLVVAGGAINELSH